MCSADPHVLAVDTLAPFARSFLQEMRRMILGGGGRQFCLRARLLVGLVSAAVCPPTLSGEDGSRPGVRHLDVPVRQRNIVAGA